MRKPERASGRNASAVSTPPRPSPATARFTSSLRMEKPLSCPQDGHRISWLETRSMRVCSDRRRFQAAGCSSGPTTRCSQSASEAEAMTRRSFTLKAFLMVVLSASAHYAQGPAAQVPVQPAVPPVPSDFVVTPKGEAKNWPSFRGPNASGVGDGQGAVVEWDVAAGKNVLWKTPVPGLANSSPVVWGNRIYVTTAISGAGDTTFQAGISGNIRSHEDNSEHTLKLYALDAANGAIVWEKEVHKAVPRTKRHPKASHASSTAVTDGRRIVVLFGNAGVLAAYDMNGQQIWKKDLGVIDMGYSLDPTAQWGHSSSPILYQNSTIVQIDQLKGSYIAAYNAADGTELWKTMREDEISTWGTPAVVSSSAGDELVTNGTKIRGYDA